MRLRGQTFRALLAFGALVAVAASSGCTKVECHSGDERCNGAAVDTCDTYANCGDNGVFCDSIWSEDACTGATSTCMEQRQDNGATVAACVPPGTRTTCAATALPTSPTGVVVMGDVNGDGNVDAVVTGAGKLQAFLRADDGSFAPGPTSADAWNDQQTMTAGDFDADGILDIAALSYDASSETGVGQVTFAKGIGGGAFAAPAPFSSSNVNAANGPLLAADFDEDGSFDILSGSSLLLAHDPRSTSRSIDWGSSCQDAVAISVADLDGDQHVDIVGAIGGDVCVAFGDGKGSFAGAIQVLAGAYVLTRVGDFDGDSHLDIVAADTSDSFAVVLGHGDRTFGAPVSANASIALGLGELFPVDVDFDGRADLVFGDGTTLGIALATGGGAFGAPVYFAPKASNAASVEIVAALVTKNPPRVDTLVVSGGQVESIAGSCR